MCFFFYKIHRINYLELCLPAKQSNTHSLSWSWKVTNFRGSCWVQQQWNKSFIKYKCPFKHQLKRYLLLKSHETPTPPWVQKAHVTGEKKTHRDEQRRWRIGAVSKHISISLAKWNLCIYGKSARMCYSIMIDDAWWL